jgi:xanthine dehydrogenase iron-sulfur cluster and FAD-binding subunit A
MPSIDFTLNGQPRHLDIRAGESLLETLRERCDLTSLKDGCRPQGQCGCCLAIVVSLYRPSGGQYYGGTVAAPCAGEILADAMQYMQVPPEAGVKTGGDGPGGD